MSEESIKSHNLEHVLYKILELQSKPETGSPGDTMLMLSLLNLLGIVSLLNKQSFPAASTQASGINPLVGMLGGMLGGQQKAGGENAGSRQGGGLPLNAAALLNLISPQAGNQVDPALLLKLLGGLLKSVPQPDEKSRPGESKAVVESPQNSKAAEVKKRNTIPSWDSRLGAG